MGLKKYFIKPSHRESIEAEEIFLDTEAIRSLEKKGKLEQPIKNRNFIFLYAFIILVLSGLFLRAGHLQIIQGERYSEISRGNKLRIYSIVAPRGMIYDCFNQPLVYNIPSFDLALDLADFLENPFLVQEKILEKIIKIVSVGGEESALTKDELRREIDEASGDVSSMILLKNIEREAALALESWVGNWSGARLEKNARRQYPFGERLAHVLGYTGQINPLELKKGTDYLLNAQIGKDGLERQYEEVLRGEPGQEQVEIDALGRTKSLLASKPSEPGQGLVLFIDSELQEKIYFSLEGMFAKLSLTQDKTNRAAVVAIDPNNGGVLAMVSLPSFDSNFLVQGISQKELDALAERYDKPFLNRTIAGQYPPGSTIKPFIAAAALEEKIVSSENQINCTGLISIVNEYNPSIVYRYPDWKAHGLTDVVKAIAESCNVYFYTVGGGYERFKGLGVDRIKKYLQNFGLGQGAGIDLLCEEAGLIPDEEWKAARGEDWYLGDTYHLSIGQGDILVTPLQMAMAVSSIANGGILHQPRLVDKIVDLNRNIIEKKPVVVARDDFIQQDNIATVQKGMRQAVLAGSAVSLDSLPVEVAGKTGTAQFGTEGRTHSWFVGYAPYNNPQIVLAVLIEGGGEGHKAAVPVAKEVLEWYFDEE